ncbi:MAG: M20/M25/M40 family metallo-hydrolase [Rhizobiaceae bacterium]|nr:M20/M25/M40 family metallo-hydrolase [Rhizobiaceae bacterium]
MVGPIEPAQARELVREFRSDLLALAVDLVRTPTENRAPYGDEAAGQRVLKAFFADTGVEIDEFEPTQVAGIEQHEAWWPGRDYQDRPNVVVTLPGHGNGRSLVFNGHMDTVGRAPLPWRTGDPFSGHVDGDRLYGRGGYDMKGGVAACATVIKILASKGIQLPGRILLHSVVDEENAGANGTLACLLRGHTGDLGIIPEPTNMQVCPHTRGGQVFHLRARGQGGVAYAGERTVNPAVLIARAILRLQEYETEINATRPAKGLYRNSPHPRDLVMAKIAAGDLSEGGNIGIPVEAFAEFFVQTLPGMDEAALRAELDQALKHLLVARDGGELHLERASRYLFGADTPVDHPGVVEVLGACRDLLQQDIEPTGANFGGDGYLFNRYFDTPTVHLGPSGGNAHGPDEWVSVESLVSLTEVLLLTASRWTSGR